jgi:type VI secretion system protein ImpA
MTQYDLESLLAPIGDESPAGNDLEYDPEFLALERAAALKAEKAIGDSVKAAEEPDWDKVAELAKSVLGRS